MRITVQHLSKHGCCTGRGRKLSKGPRTTSQNSLLSLLDNKSQIPEQMLISVGEK